MGSRRADGAAAPARLVPTRRKVVGARRFTPGAALATVHHMRWSGVALLLLASTATFADGGWQEIGREDGVVVEAREVAGSPLHEIRATAHATVPPEAVLEVLWRHAEHPSFVPHLAHLDVVRDAGDERIVYEQITFPLLKDRDVVLRVRRARDLATGTIDVTSAAITDEGPPPTSAFVRVTANAGHWHLVPSADGGTDVTYTIRTDAGGHLPAWVANRAQRSAVPELVQAMLHRAEADVRQAHAR